MNSLRRDLFERRLWPVAAVLLLAIIAVPLLLRSGADASPISPVPPVPALASGQASTSGAGTSQTEPVPVSAMLSRSAALRNPFASDVVHLTPTAPSRLSSSPTSDSAENTTETNPTTSATTTPSESSDSSQSSGDSSTPATSSAGSASGTGAVAATTVTMTTTVTTPAVTRTATVTTASGAAATTPTSWKIYHVDVSIEDQGQTLTRSNLERLTPLPAAATPEAMFDGVAAGGHDAVFALAAGVTVQGPAFCRPDHAHCSVILLPVGDLETLAFTSGSGQAETLSLTLSHISAKVTHSQTEALAAAKRESAAGACELELANPVQYNGTTLITTAKAQAACLLAPGLVAFPGVDSGA